MHLQAYCAFSSRVFYAGLIGSCRTGYHATKQMLKCWNILEARIRWGSPRYHRTSSDDTEAPNTCPAEEDNYNELIPINTRTN
jgi:hypothetical protein